MSYDPYPAISVDSQWLNAHDSFNKECESETYVIGSHRLLYGEADTEFSNPCGIYGDYVKAPPADDSTNDSLKEFVRKRVDYERTHHGPRDVKPKRFSIDRITPGQNGRGTSITAIIRHLPECELDDNGKPYFDGKGKCEKLTEDEPTQHYWWEVREDNITKIYGQGDKYKVKDEKNNVVKWLLQEVRVQKRNKQDEYDYDIIPVKSYSLAYESCEDKCGKYNSAVTGKHYLKTISGTQYSVKKNETPAKDHLTQPKFELEFDWLYQGALLSDKYNHLSDVDKMEERPDAQFIGSLGEEANYDFSLLKGVRVISNVQEDIKKELKKYAFSYKAYEPTNISRLARIHLTGANGQGEIEINRFDYHDDLNNNNGEALSEAVWFDQEKTIHINNSGPNIKAFSTSSSSDQGGRFHVGIGFSTNKEYSLSLSATRSSAKSSSFSSLQDCSGDGNPDFVTNNNDCFLNAVDQTGVPKFDTNPIVVAQAPTGKGKGRNDGLALGFLAPVISLSAGLTRSRNANFEYSPNANGDGYQDWRGSDGLVKFALGEGEFSGNVWDTRIPMESSSVQEVSFENQIEKTNCVGKVGAEKEKCIRTNEVVAMSGEIKNSMWVETKKVLISGDYNLSLTVKNLKKHEVDLQSFSYKLEGNLRPEIFVKKGDEYVKVAGCTSNNGILECDTGTLSVNDEILYVIRSSDFGGKAMVEFEGHLTSEKTSPTLSPYASWKYTKTKTFQDEFQATASVAGRGRLSGGVSIKGVSNDSQFNRSFRMKLIKRITGLDSKASETKEIQGACTIAHAIRAGDTLTFYPRINENGKLVCGTNEEGRLLNTIVSVTPTVEIAGYGVEISRDDGQKWPADMEVDSNGFTFQIEELILQEGKGKLIDLKEHMLDIMVASLESVGSVDNEDHPPKDVPIASSGNPPQAIEHCELDSKGNGVYYISNSDWLNENKGTSETCRQRSWIVRSDAPPPLQIGEPLRIVSPLPEALKQIYSIPVSHAYRDIERTPESLIEAVSIATGESTILLPNFQFLKKDTGEIHWFDGETTQEVKFNLDLFDIDGNLKKSIPWSIVKNPASLSLTCDQVKLPIAFTGQASEKWSFDWEFKNAAVSRISLLNTFLESCEISSGLLKDISFVEWGNFKSSSTKLDLPLENAITAKYFSLNDPANDHSAGNRFQTGKNVFGVLAKYVLPSTITSSNVSICSHEFIGGHNGWDSSVFLTDESATNLPAIFSGKQCSEIKKEKKSLKALTVVPASYKQLATSSRIGCLEGSSNYLFGLSGPDLDICLAKSGVEDLMLSLGKIGNSELEEIDNCELARVTVPDDIKVAKQCKNIEVRAISEDDSQYAKIEKSKLVSPSGSSLGGKLSQSISLPTMGSKSKGTNFTVANISTFMGSLSTSEGESEQNSEALKRGVFSDYLINGTLFAAKRSGKLEPVNVPSLNSSSTNESLSISVTGDSRDDIVIVSPFPTYGRSKSEPNVWYENYNSDQFIDRFQRNSGSSVSVSLGNRTGWNSNSIEIGGYLPGLSVNLTTSPGLVPSSGRFSDDQIIGAIGINTGAYGITAGGQYSESATDTKCSFVGIGVLEDFCADKLKPRKSYTVSLDGTGRSSLIKQSHEHANKVKIQQRSGTGFATQQDVFELNATGDPASSNNRLLTKGYTKGLSVSYAYGIPVLAFFIDFGGGVNSSNGRSETFSGFLDINGDGFDDYVRCGTWGCAFKRNRHGRTNLLKKVTDQRGSGSAQFVDYQRKLKSEQSPIALWQATVLAKNNFSEQTGNDFSLQYRAYENHLYERGKKRSIGYGKSYALTIKDRSPEIAKAIQHSADIVIDGNGLCSINADYAEKSAQTFSLENNLSDLKKLESKVLCATSWTMQKIESVTNDFDLHGSDLYTTTKNNPAAALNQSGLVKSQTTYLKNEEGTPCYPNSMSKCFISDTVQNTYQTRVLSTVRYLDETGPTTKLTRRTITTGEVDNADKDLDYLHPKRSIQIQLVKTAAEHYEVGSGSSIKQCRTHQYFYDSLGYQTKIVDHGVDCDTADGSSANNDNVITRLSFTGMESLAYLSEENVNNSAALVSEKNNSNLGTSNQMCGWADITGVVDAISVEHGAEGEATQLKRLRFDEYECLGEQAEMPGELRRRSIAVNEEEYFESIEFPEAGIVSRAVKISTLKFADYIYNYDAEYGGLLRSMTAPGGYTTYYEYDRDRPGYIVEIRDNLEQAIDIEYDWKVAKINKRIGTAGEVMALEYDAFGRIVSEVNPMDFHRRLKTAEPDLKSVEISYCLPGAAASATCDLPTSESKALYRKYIVGDGRDETQTLNAAVTIALFANDSKPWRTFSRRAAPPGASDQNIGISINGRAYLDTAGRVYAEAPPVWCSTELTENITAETVKEILLSNTTPQKKEAICEKYWEKQLFGKERETLNWRQFISEKGHYNDKASAIEWDETKLPRRAKHNYDLLGRNIATIFPDKSRTTNAYKLVATSAFSQFTERFPSISSFGTLLQTNSIDKKGANNLSFSDSRDYLFAKAKTADLSIPMPEKDTVGPPHKALIGHNKSDIWVTYKHNSLGELEKINEWFVRDNAWSNGFTQFKYDLLGRNTLIDHPDMGVRQFAYTDRNYPIMTCAGLLEDNTFESVNIVTFDSTETRPIQSLFYKPLAEKSKPKKRDSDGSRSASCKVSEFQSEHANNYSQSMAYLYEWGRPLSQDQRTIGTSHWVENNDYRAGKLITETKSQILAGDASQLLYRKSFKYDENGMTISLFHDIASPLYDWNAIETSDPETLIRASTSFTLTDNHSRPTDSYSIQGKRITSVKDLIDQQGKLVLNTAFHQKWNYGTSSAQDERLAEITMMAGTGMNEPVQVVSNMYYDEYGKQVRWAQQNGTFSISHHFNPFTQLLDSTVGAKRDSDSNPYAWHHSYFKSIKNEPAEKLKPRNDVLFERIYEYESQQGLGQESKTGNIAAIDLSISNGESNLEESGERPKISASVRYEAEYDTFSRLVSGVGSHSYRDTERVAHPAFARYEKKGTAKERRLVDEPNAGCYFQTYSFDDRNNLTKRKHFVLDDVIRNQANHYSKPIIRGNKDRLGSTAFFKDVKRSQWPAWKILRERQDFQGIEQDGRDPVNYVIGTKTIDQLQESSLKDIPGKRNVDTFCQKLAEDSDQNLLKLESSAKTFHVLPTGKTEDADTHNGIEQHYVGSTILKKPHPFDSWYDDSKLTGAHIEHDYTIQTPRRDLLINKGSVMQSYDYSASSLHRPVLLSKTLNPSGNLIDEEDTLTYTYDARGQLTGGLLTNTNSETCSSVRDGQLRDSESCKSSQQEITWDEEGNKVEEFKLVQIGHYREDLTAGSTTRNTVRSTSGYKSDNTRLVKSERKSVLQETRSDFDELNAQEGSLTASNSDFNQEMGGSSSRVYSQKNLHFDASHRFHTRDVYLGEQRIASFTIDTKENADQQLDLITQYYHANHVGTVDLETNEKIEVTRYASYDPYGLSVVESDQRQPASGFSPPQYGFVGKELDLSGSYYFGARYYNPKSVVWLKGDPYLHGDIQYLESLNNLSVFSYGYHSPLVGYDADGNSVKTTTIWSGVTTVAGVAVMIAAGAVAAPAAGAYLAVTGVLMFSMGGASTAVGISGMATGMDESKIAATQSKIAEFNTPLKAALSPVTQMMSKDNREKINNAAQIVDFVLGAKSGPATSNSEKWGDIIQDLDIAKQGSDSIGILNDGETLFDNMIKSFSEKEGSDVQLP